MGRIIDRAVALALAATALYLLFFKAFGSILLACALAFVCCALLMRPGGWRTRSGKMSTLDAQALLNQWAFGDDEVAKCAIAKLLDRPEGTIAYLPRHPSASLGVGDVFGAWKSHRDRDALILAAPCRADARARAFARTLKEPRVELADAGRLIALIRKSDLTLPRVRRTEGRFEHLKLALLALPGCRPWHQHLLSGLALMGLYLIAGNAAYLFLSIGCLFLAGVAHCERI